MQTVSVRIKAEQARRLHEVADMIPGSSINGLVQRAVKQLLDNEAPVYLAKLKEACQEVQERQAVGTAVSIRPSERA